MITVKSFTFNSFEENTYVLFDETKQCIIIDPGCHLPDEEQELSEYIAKLGLKPVRLINTHCHIDHILGNYFVSSHYDLKPEIHKDELKVLESSLYVSQLYQINLNPSPEPESYIAEGDEIHFGNSRLEVLLTPGHSPASISFYSRDDQFVISGDVLFENSIGRTDLPGGNYEVLINAIITKLLPLGDKVKVYPGHGNATSIGAERLNNPFLREHLQH